MLHTPHYLVTGGTGFFGRALLRHWIEHSEQTGNVVEVTVLTRGPDQFLASHPEFSELDWLRFHQGDILQPNSLPKHARFTHILHAATDSTLGPQLTPLERYTQIVDGTRHILDFALKQGVSRILLTSSGGVYGPQPADLERIPETYNGMPDPLNPAMAYGVAKRCAEHLCTLYQQAYGLETMVARCFAFVGPDLPLDVHFAIGNFIRDALYAESINVQGDGSPLRSYMDQRDLAQWLTTLLIDGKAKQAYNVGSDRAVSILELANTVRDLLAPHKPVHVMGAPNTSALRNRYIPSIEKAKSELGLHVSIPLEDSIRFAAKVHSAREPQ